MTDLCCGVWDCGNYGPYLKVKWQEHLRDKFRVAGALGSQISLHHVQPEDFEALRKCINRRDKNYVRVELETGAYAVFTDAFNSGMALDQAERTMEDIIASLPFDRKRVSTSRTDWKQPKSENTGEWERVATVNVTMEEARNVVEGPRLVVHGLGTDNKTLGWNCRTAFEFTVPQNWLDNGGEGYEILLEWLRMGIPPPIAQAA